MDETLEYEQLLKRAKEKQPIKSEDSMRLNVPDPDIYYHGRNTIIKNFGDITGVIRRDESQMVGYLLKELGTPGVLDGKRLIFKSKVAPGAIIEKIKTYIHIFVICPQCNRPDTKLIKEDRVLFIECEACGAKCSIASRKR